MSNLTINDWGTSVSACLYAVVTNWSNTYTNQPDRVFKQITTETAYCGIILLGTIEATVRLISTLFVKVIIQILPADRKHELDEQLVHNMTAYHAISAAAVGAALKGLVTNFTRRPTTDDDIHDTWKIEATEEIGLNVREYCQANAFWLKYLNP